MPVCVSPRLIPINALILLVWYCGKSLLCALLILHHKNDWYNSQVFKQKYLQKYLQKYKHLQPPDTDVFLPWYI